MKQKVNYIDHHKKVSMRIAELDISSTHISVYNALFLLWNNSGFPKDLSVNRNDVMILSKIGSNKTYLKCLNDLDKHKIIVYKPSFNPLIGSIIEMCRFDTGKEQVGNSFYTSSAIGSDQGSDQGSTPLYKLLNKKTIKLINNNASLVNSNLEKWIDTETNEQDDKQINKETSKQSFELFWNLYDKKVDKKKTFDKWLKLNQSEIDAIIEITPKYVKANSDVQYRKNPLTFLNGRCWEDEIQEETKSYDKNSRTSHVHIEKKTTESDFVDINNL